MSDSARSLALDEIRVRLTDAERADIRNRLKSARGHIDHVVASVEEEKYVVDVLRQAAAVRGALDSLIRMVLRSYFLGTFSTAVTRGKEADAIEELMAALTFLKRSGDDETV
jgi:DNA-binding FrmR family transcriptional regulator